MKLTTRMLSVHCAIIMCIKLRGQNRGARSSGSPHKRPFVGVSQGTILGVGDGFGAILRGTVAKK